MEMVWAVSGRMSWLVIFLDPDPDHFETWRGNKRISKERKGKGFGLYDGLMDMEIFLIRFSMTLDLWVWMKGKRNVLFSLSFLKQSSTSKYKRQSSKYGGYGKRTAFCWAFFFSLSFSF